MNPYDNFLEANVGPTGQITTNLPSKPKPTQSPMIGTAPSLTVNSGTALPGLTYNTPGTVLTGNIPTQPTTIAPTIQRQPISGTQTQNIIGRVNGTPIYGGTDAYVQQQYNALQNANRTTADGLPINPMVRNAILNTEAPVLSQEEIDRQAIIDRIRQEQFATPKTKEELMQENLRLRQSEIDSINTMYADMINRARAAGKLRTEAALGSNRAMQARSGMLQSTFGEAATSNLRVAQEEITNAEVAKLANEQATRISSLMGAALRDATDEYNAKIEARRLGADKLLEELAKGPEERKNRAKSALSAYILDGGKIEDLTPQQLKEFSMSYKISESDIKTIYNTAVAEANALAMKSEKEAAEIEKEKANTLKIIAETGQIGKMTPGEAARLGISQQELNLAKQKFEFEKSKGGEQYYDGKTIPQDMKANLSKDILAKKVTLGELIQAYPKVDTKYLADLLESVRK